MNATVLRTEILPRLQRVKPEAGGYRASCPVSGHGSGRGDRTPSFTVGVGTTQPIVFKCHAGCGQDDIKDALIGLGVNWTKVTNPASDDAHKGDDTWMPCGWDADTRAHNPRHHKVAEYLYHDADGNLVFAVARCALKGNGCQGFRQWRPDPTKKTGRTWSRKLPDGTKVGEGLPYRLPGIVRAIELGRTVYLVEGEKDADRLMSLGFPATCCAEGAGKWTPAHAEWLTGADLVVVTDRDDVGWNHTEAVVNTLVDLARSVEVARAAEGKDVSDHLDAGLKMHQLVTIAEPLPPPLAVPGCPDCAAEAAG